MRDHSRLIAFQAAAAVVAAVCELVRTMPLHERYALGLQLRRASLSAASNIVEGCARETQYQIEVALRLGDVKPEKQAALRDAAARSSQLLSRLLARVRRFRAADSRAARGDERRG